MRVWDGATLLRLCIPGGGRWEGVIARLVVYALVPSIRLWLVSRTTEADRLLSLCTRFGPWDGGLRLCVGWALLFIVFGVVAVSGWSDNDRKVKHIHSL